MPGKHAPASPQSFYVSLGKAVGASAGAVALMVAAVLILLGRGGSHPTGSPAIDTSHPTVSAQPSTRPSVRPTHTSSPSPGPSIMAVSDVTVHVQNGTKRSGLAKKTADQIKAQGYNVVRVDNAPAFAKSTIFYATGHRAEALAFQKSFPDFTVLRERDNPGGEILRAVIGADWPQSTG